MKASKLKMGLYILFPQKTSRRIETAPMVLAQIIQIKLSLVIFYINICFILDYSVENQ